MANSFHFTRYAFDEKACVLVLEYQSGEKELFQERIVFPKTTLTDAQRVALDQAFYWIHLAVGISYYKAFLPKEIKVDTKPMTKSEADFFNDFYLKGLGEFAFQNNLNLQGKIRFPFAKGARSLIDVPLSNEALVAVGGGKDSCVSIELLKETGHHPTLFSVGTARPIEECESVSGLPFVSVKRTIDARLIELNTSGAAYNGHVPITGIIAFISLALAIMQNKRFVVLSNEKSANVGNIKQGDLDINHQWSKSLEFEKSFQALTGSVFPNFTYFSLLRPLAEIQIAQLFAQKCAAYFPVFTSCNRAFKLDLSKRLDRWCGTCDKCRFVFLMLAPFMDKETLVHLMGVNPLNDPEQQKGYEELLGLSGIKPFECVGEADECRLALSMLMQKPGWQNDVLVKKLAKPADIKLTLGDHLIPKEFDDVVQKFGK